MKRRNRAAAMEGREKAMFAIIEFSRNTQRTLCMLMSVAIVALTVSFNAYEAQSALHDGYSVTITQLQ
jgi:hypothetical protein